MKDTIISFPLQKLGYEEKYVITSQGIIIDTANQTQLQPTKNNKYRLTTNEGKTVYRALKPLYRLAFGKEIAKDEIENLPNEVWKEIDSKGKYFVSNRGRIKSYQYQEAKILTPYTNQRGYNRVDISIDGYRRSYTVHYLVATAFIPNDKPIEKDTIDHIDENKSNNCIENLQWVSRAENIKLYQQRKKNRSVFNGNQNSSQLEDCQCIEVGKQ